MKSIIKTIAALALLTALAICNSCNNGLLEPTDSELNSDRVVTITIALPSEESTKVAISDDQANNKLRITGWATGDKVTMCKKYNSAIYTSDFTWVSGNTFSGTLPEHADGVKDIDYAVYNASEIRYANVSQGIDFYPKHTVSTDVKDVILLAAENDGNGNFAMQHMGSILKATNQSGTSIEAAMKLLAGAAYGIKQFHGVLDYLHIVRCGWSDDLSFESAKFTIPTGTSYIYLPILDSGKKVGICDAYDGTTNSDASVVPFGSVATGKIYTYTVRKRGELSGEFTVNSDGRKVHFSKGILYYDRPNDVFKFENNQYSYSEFSNNHYSIFNWSSLVEVACAYTYDHTQDQIAKTNVLFTNNSNVPSSPSPNTEFTVEGTTGAWRVLAADEWNYLLKTRTMPDGKNRFTSAEGISIEGSVCHGAFLYPDGYNGPEVSSTMTWDAINRAGIVFLPDENGRGYWLPSCYNNASMPYFIIISSDSETNLSDRSYKRFIRLVTG